MNKITHFKRGNPKYQTSISLYKFQSFPITPSCFSSILLDYLRKKHLFSSSVQFLTRLSGVLKFLSCMRSSYIFDINPIFDISLANTFSHSVGYFFILSMVSFAVHRFFSFDAISLVKFCVCFIIYPIVVQFPYL